MKNELNEYGENVDCRNLNRWRLILGSFSNLEIDNEYSEIDETLNFLYDREYTQNGGYSLDNFNNSNSSKEKSALTVPKWISKVKKLFPKETVEIMQKQALEKYKLTEILTDENILKEIEPNIELLKNILTFKDMMSQNVKKLAYDYIKRSQASVCIMGDEKDGVLSLYLVNDTENSVKIEYSVKNLYSAKEVLKETATCDAFYSQKITEITLPAGDKSFYLFTWTYDGKKASNHFHTGVISLSLEKYLKALESAGFDEWEGF